MKTIKVPIGETRELQMIDVTPLIQKEVTDYAHREGFIILFVQGSTGALTTIEYEPGLMEDPPLSRADHTQGNRVSP